MIIIIFFFYSEGIMFCPWGIDWMVVVCYWWIWCEWQVVPSCLWTCHQRKEEISKRERKLFFYSRLWGHMNNNNKKRLIIKKAYITP